jgi:protein-S-isoprenylcysteine O-methyltransferase Ste14
MLSLWAVPVMTAGRLLFALGLSAYILIGIAFEERDLLRRFGERYRDYRERVGMLIPRARRARRTTRDRSGTADPRRPSAGA